MELGSWLVDTQHGKGRSDEGCSIRLESVMDGVAPRKCSGFVDGLMANRG